MPINREPFEDREAAAIAARLKFVKKMVGLGVSGLVLLIFLIFGWPLTIVDSGHVGVVRRLGAVQTSTLPEGLNIIRPFTDSVVEMSVQKQLYEVEAAAASKDLQDVHTKLAVNFHVIPDKAWWVWKNLRTEYDIRVVAPAVQEAVKAATAQFAADDLIRHRETVKEKIKTALTAKLMENNLQVDEVSIVNFDFAKLYKEAIEAKQVAEQNALKAKNDVERVKQEAQQQIETAKAQAEMLRLQSQQITPMMLELEAIKKWDGVMPQFIGSGATPFVNIDKFGKK